MLVTNNILNAYETFGSNGITKVGNTFNLGGTLNQNTTITTGSNTLTVAGSNGLRYATDISSNYTNRSLVDKQYTDNKISDNTYSPTWNGVVNIAPSQNAVYDKIEILDSSKLNLSGGTMSNNILFLNNFGIDTTSSGGVDILNIGNNNADVINIGRTGTTINIIGSTNYQQVTNLQVSDKLITLNKGGSLASASFSGMEFEENGLITGFIKTNSSRNSFSYKAPSIASIADLSLNSLTSDRIYIFPDKNGTFALLDDITNSVTFGSNGITKVGNTFNLGGTLNQNTTITTGSNTLTFYRS
jgi:uncharacterized Zn-binding protein involved in type VI secretion